jgi:hypothetical protein
MKRSGALGKLLCALLFFYSSNVAADVVIGPGVQPVIKVYTGDHYHLLAGTQITSPSLSVPPADTYLRVDDAVNLEGGGSVRIDGGTYRGGNHRFTGTDPFFTAAAGNALELRNFTADIHGGMFTGGDTYSVTQRSDHAIGGVGLYAAVSTVNIYGGRFDAGLLTLPNVPYYPSNYPQVPDAFFIASTVHWHGGDLSYIVLGLGSTLHIYGTNFETSGFTVYGRFADRSPFALLVNDGLRNVVLHNLVPEPHALALAVRACVLFPERRRALPARHRLVSRGSDGVS